MELARLAQEAERDVICAHWANTKAKRPSGYTVVLRDVLSVDVLSDCTAYMWGEGRLALVSVKEKLTIWVGDRGLLQRGQGVPEHLLRGAKLANIRIRNAAEGRDSALLDGNRFMPMGGEWTRVRRARRRTGSSVLTNPRALPGIIMVTTDAAPDPGGVGVLRRFEDAHHQRGRGTCPPHPVPRR